jgi:pyridoxine kinase
LPSAILSTHTAGFSGFTFRDLAGDMPSILAHWEKEGIFFDGIYTGYLGSSEQVDYVLDIKNKTLKEGGLFIVDPAFGDNGKLYPIFNQEYVDNIKRLVSKCDVVVPNLTELCYLCDEKYLESYTEEDIKRLVLKIVSMGAKAVVLTGISYEKGYTGIVTYDGEFKYYKHEFLPNSCHGTGDIYASSFVGAVMKGNDIYTSAKIAGDYTLECIRKTAGDKNHWYGAKFELALPMLVEKLNK